MKNIFKYLRRTKDLLLIFGGGLELKVEGYTDSDFIIDVDDRKFKSGYIFVCNGGAVSWKNFKQPIITDSIMKVEFIATSEVAKEVFWFKKFIMELSVIPSNTITLHCNNNSTIAITKEPKSYEKSKHIKWWFYIIREYLKKKFVEE